MNIISLLILPKGFLIIYSALEMINFPGEQNLQHEFIQRVHTLMTSK